MREEYDFSNARPNPYAKKLKTQVTVNQDKASENYFKKQAASRDLLETGAYQKLIQCPRCHPAEASGEQP